MKSVNPKYRNKFNNAELEETTLEDKKWSKIQGRIGRLILLLLLDVRH